MANLKGTQSEGRLVDVAVCPPAPDPFSVLAMPGGQARHVNAELSAEVPPYAVHNEQVIKGFFGDYRFLSNFYPAPIRWRGMLFPAVEHAYQAFKYPEERWGEFLSIRAGAAKRLGRKAILAGDWDVRKGTLMAELVRTKFNQHPDLALRLLGTGNRYLEETNSWGDRFWGVYDGAGENQLGRILMRLRGDLRKRAARL